jgi:predicted transposase YbfD/YdcC
VTEDVARLIERHPDWNTIRPTGEKRGETGDRETGDKASGERRHCVSSLPADAELLAFAARAHRGTENPLSYIPDVAFREDACPASHGFSPENLTSIRKPAMTLARAMWNRNCA